MELPTSAIVSEPLAKEESETWNDPLDRFDGEGLTFDDVLLVPRRSDTLPRDTDITTRFSRGIALNIPLVSAAMDTVTEAELAIALAREGGIGVIHKNLTVEDQACEVDKVKRSESGLIVDPVTLPPDATIGEARRLMKQFGISGLPIVRDSVLVGILTNRDLRFVDTDGQPVVAVMTKDHRLVTAPVGTTLAEAQVILQEHRIEKLPIVDDAFRLCGLITFKDLQKRLAFPAACKDTEGRLRVAAAVGAGEDLAERAAALVAVGVDALVVDSAHGHSANVLDAVWFLRNQYPNLQIVAGNIATAAAARELIELGVDAIKVGMGPGSTCTTRVVAGCGMPQLTAIRNVAAAAVDASVPVIADGGIKYSGDVVKAIAFGASAVMIGNLFAGTDESPGETVLYEGRSYKVYRGMGSVGALKVGSADRYFQEGLSVAKLVAEGIEGRVPNRGPLKGVVFQLIGGLKQGMGYCGSRTISELQRDTRFVRNTSAGLRESHPHNVTITSEAPNYSPR